jgi:4-hydroxybenzoate polyprenyltransferase
MNPLSQLSKWGEFVKISHTIFALPFALASMVVAARDFEYRGWPGWRLFLLIVAAVFCARTCAMAFNRIVDRKFDAKNPRTAERHLPAEVISLPSAWSLWILSAIGFLAVAYHINPVCFYLAPVALFVVCFYSLTKRFTDFTHIYLGIALALAPIGAWLAVQGTIHITPIILALAVVCWLIGFDIIYALQDYEFDRANGLHSLVVRWGPKNALQFAFLIHMLMWALLVLFGFINRFRAPYFIGVLLILISLLFEHWLARRRSLKWINTAFFRLNALISIIFLTTTIASVVFLPFRWTLK